MRIALVAFALSPRGGSEERISWNWAVGLAEHHEVWVIAHPFYRADVEPYLRQLQGSLHLVWTNPAGNLGPGTSNYVLRGIRFALWIKAAERQLCSLNRKHHFDLAQWVSYGSIAVPPRFWRLDVPCIWGPLGGGQTMTAKLASIAGPVPMSYRLRVLQRLVLKVLPKLRHAVRTARLVLVTNKETAAIVERYGSNNVRYFLDSGIGDNQLLANVPDRSSRSTLELLWVGRLLHRKALPLALQALHAVGDLSVHLTVAGDGPMRGIYKRDIQRLGLQDRVTILGMVPLERVFELCRVSDALLFTSICDTFGSQVLEAMAQGLPVITLDHQGVGAFLPGAASIKVPVTTPTETVTGLANAIRSLENSAALRSSMAIAALEFARTQTWPRRIARMNDLYAEVVGKHRECEVVPEP